MTTPDIVVLRQGTEGLNTAEYADEIRTRLTDQAVARATTPAEERELTRHARVITGNGIDTQLLKHTENLELFACVFAGYDHLPMDSLIEQGVCVTNASGIHAPGIAEQIIGNILVFSRNLHEGWRRKRNREWRHYKADELVDKTVTVVGLGAIGTETVQRLQGFDVHTIGVRHTPEKGSSTDELIGYDEDAFHDALAQTDYLALACPLTETTRGLIGKEELITLPPNAVVINSARGGLIDHDALEWAIRDESIRGAALDVTNPEPLPEDHPLWGLENVMITPHMGGHTPKHWERIADILAQNYRAVVEEGRPSDIINSVI